MNPIEFFFSLGDRVTGGDIKRKMDWNYYMLWVMFISFLIAFIGYVREFIQTQRLSLLGWGCVILAILWFQYSNLEMTYKARKLMNQKIELPSEEEMLKEFNKDIVSVNTKSDKEFIEENKKIFNNELKGGLETHEDTR